MKFDLCQSPVSLSDDATVREWDGMIRAFLSHGTATPQHLGAVLAAAPSFAMGHAARGLFSMMLGRAEMVTVARDALRDARAALADKTPTRREMLWVIALDRWLSGRPSGSVAAMEEILDKYPTDTLSAKVSHAIRFILGDINGMRASVERVLEAHDAKHACRGYLLGCHAFTLEETGEYDCAEATGREGLALAPDDAWGLHAVAHVFDMTARPDLGITLIEDHTQAWDHCNNFRYHVWWHKALLHMDRGQFDVAMGLYDAQIRAEKTDDYRDISNATSLLIRLELEGMDVGHRWDELADLSQARTEDGCLVFADLHYMLALSGADRPEARVAMLARLASDAAKPGEMQQRYAQPGVAALTGLNAFAEGRYDAAFADLLAARPHMQSVGGSHAQRDVMERITIDAGLRAGRYAQTEALLADRQAIRGGAVDHYAARRLATLARAQQIPAQ